MSIIKRTVILSLLCDIVIILLFNSVIADDTKLELHLFENFDVTKDIFLHEIHLKRHLEGVKDNLLQQRQIINRFNKGVDRCLSNWGDFLMDYHFL